MSLADRPGLLAHFQGHIPLVDRAMKRLHDPSARTLLVFFPSAFYLTRGYVGMIILNGTINIIYTIKVCTEGKAA